MYVYANVKQYSTGNGVTLFFFLYIFSGSITKKTGVMSAYLMPYYSRLFQIYMTVRRDKLSRSLLLHLSKFLLVLIYVYSMYFKKLKFTSLL